MRRWRAIVSVAVAGVTCLCVPCARAQDVQSGEPQGPSPWPHRVTCPGDPAGNLASTHCEFTMPMRLNKFLGDAVTDQALLGAGFYGAVAQLRRDPEEWDASWDGLGRRVGVRYVQSFAKGAAAFGVSSLLRSDPRLLRYADDPKVTQPRTGVTPRLLHALGNWAGVRRSSYDGKGTWLPNGPLVAGAVASAYAGNPWYPDRLTTRREVRARIASSLGTALAASFFHEFQPEIGRVLGALFKRGRAPSGPMPATTGGER